MNVRFFAGTKKEYLSLATHNPQALYFCADTQELYWGDMCLSDGIRVVETKADLPSLDTAADGIVYYVTKTRNAYTLSPDRTYWIQTIYAPVHKAEEVDESEVYETVTTVGLVRDLINKLRDDIAKDLENIEVPELDNYALKSDLADKANVDHNHNDLYEAKGAAEAVKNELLNGAGDAFNTLKELGDLIKDNVEAIDALESLAAGKADKDHEHTQYLTADNIIFN